MYSNTNKKHMDNLDLEKIFEQETGNAAWINSDIYPDGKIHTREYVEWLAEKVKALVQIAFPL